MNTVGARLIKYSRWALASMAAIALLSGCASLHEDVFENIHEGDSSAHVVDILGQPDSFAPSVKIEGAKAWFYVRRSEQCAFTIHEDIVKIIGCGARPGYVNPIGAALKTMGDGLTRSGDDTVHCTTTGGDGLYNTNCH